MKEKEHLPIIGVGPIYVIIIIAFTVIGIVLSKVGVLPVAKIPTLQIPFLVLGIIFILFGVGLWGCANFQSRVFEGIKDNRLVTTGVYAHVRNPIYSAFMMMCIGALFIAGNLWLLLLIFFYWGFMTILMKNTEEKWLRNLYGKEYEEYCKKVNRCIPWF